jgi:hypothetical protein
MLGAAETPSLRLTLASTKKTFATGEVVPIAWKLENVSREPLRVISRHDAGGVPQFDELTAEISRGGGAPFSLALVGPRAATRAVWVVLSPGESVEQQFDLRAAMTAAGRPLQSGRYVVSAQYSLGPMQAEKSWSGTLRTAVPLEFTIG